MVLSGPQGIEAKFIHEHGELFGHAETLDEPFIRVAPRVRRGAVSAHVFQLNLPNIENRKVLDHEVLSSIRSHTISITRTYAAGCRRRNSTQGLTATQSAVT